MKKLSSNFTAFAKRDFFILAFIVLAVLTYLFLKNSFYLAAPLLILFWIVLPIRYFIVRKRVVEFYVDYHKKEILLDDLAGHRFSYRFSALENVTYKSGNRVKVFFSDGRSFIFFTKDLWLAELATNEGFQQNIRQEMRQIQLQKFES